MAWEPPYASGVYVVHWCGNLRTRWGKSYLRVLALESHHRGEERRLAFDGRRADRGSECGSSETGEAGHIYVCSGLFFARAAASSP
jgi:hypothetical protein